MSDEELDLRHHLTPEEERLWRKLKAETRTKEDWEDLNATIIAFQRRFIERRQPKT